MDKGQSPQKNPTLKNPKQKKKERSPFWDFFYKCIFSQKVWMVILTVFIVRFMCVQIKMSDDHTRKQLRAYLIPLKPMLTVPPESLFVYIGKPLPMMYIIRNDGQTPAYDVRDSVNVKILPRKQKPTEVPKGVRNFYYPVYGAGTSHTRKIHSGEDSLVAEKHFKGANLTKFDWVKFGIYFWGRVEYTDIFMESHSTEFCYEFVIHEPIREFRTYGQCYQADRKEPYEPFWGFLW